MCRTISAVARRDRQAGIRHAVLGAERHRPLIQHAAGYSVGALVLLLVCKTLAYGVSRGSFRGGPIFPALFIGAAGGIAMSHLPGLPLAAGVAMGIGEMTAAVMKLPLTSVLLVSLPDCHGDRASAPRASPR
jgi:H+/Cl- antiporter ClcA